MRTCSFTGKSHSQSENESCEEGSSFNVFAYDDLVSQQRRQFIRNRFNLRFFPEELSQGRLSEEELNKLILSLTKKNEINTKNIKLNAYNLAHVYKNSLTGSILKGKPEELKKLKEAGIETVISFDGDYREDVENAGLNYVNFDAANIFLKHNCAATSDKFTFISKYCRTPDEYSEKKEFGEKLYYDYSRKFIENEFIPLMKAVEEDKFYAGCNYGVRLTCEMMALIFAFNPNADLRKDRPDLSYMAINQSDICENLYNNLTDEDKKAIGFDEKQEKKFKLIMDLYKSEQHFMV